MESCYFKSTDGHMNEWSFNLRRLNLQVLDIVGMHGG
jgi:tRNA A64-2'-O-ribosylphosphate transferase